MISELVVDVQPKEITIAVLEDKKLVELQQESQDESFSVGNIYLGKVKKLMPALNAAFVNVGHKKDAFLHYLDLGVAFNSVQAFQKQVGDKKRIPQLPKMKLQADIDKEGSITDVLKVERCWYRFPRSPYRPKDLGYPPRYLSRDGLWC